MVPMVGVPAHTMSAEQLLNAHVPRVATVSFNVMLSSPVQLKNA